MVGNTGKFCRKCSVDNMAAATSGCEYPLFKGDINNFDFKENITLYNIMERKVLLKKNR